MGTGLKVFLWIVGILAVLFAGLIGIGFYIGSKSTAVIDDAEKFSSTASKLECVDELARRTAACEGVSCFMSGPMFGMMCLESAKGDKAEVCDNTESTTTLSDSSCEPFPDSEICKQVITTTLDGYCG